MKPDTKAIRARAEAATPGEWRARRHGKTFSITAGTPGKDLQIIGDVYDDSPDFGGTPGDADAEFIAAARTDVPALCDRVDELERALRRLAAAWDRLMPYNTTTLDGGPTAIEQARTALEGR